MNTTTAVNNRRILPESLVKEFAPRPTAVLIKLLIEPGLAEAAIRIHGEHGAAFTAFLLGEVELEELEPEKLEEAFLTRRMASYPDWDTARNRMLEMVVGLAEKRGLRDAEFKENFDSTHEHFFRHFSSHLRIVRIGEGIHVFANPDVLHDEES